MTLRLASDTVIRHGGNAVSLRPSLRAAVILENRYSLVPLITGVHECNLEIIEAVITATAVDPVAARRLLIAKVDANGIRQLQHLAGPLFDLIADCYGYDYQTERQDQAGKRVSIIEALATLYEFATGWLGWTADAALSATPAQITAAHKGFLAKHNAMNGVKDDADESDTSSQYDPRNLPSDEEIREGVARLKALTK